MKLLELKNLAAILVLSLIAMFGSSHVANAQGNRGYDQKQQEKIRKEQQKMDQQRLKDEQKRQAELNKRNRQRGGYYDVNPNLRPQVNRYRIMRGNSYYDTDQRGADLLRQAVDEGYRQGYAAGQADRDNRRRSDWNGSNIYQMGNYGYVSYVEQSQYQYYFRQGFQRGYDDGYNHRNRYGLSTGGKIAIVGAVLAAILIIKAY